MSTMCLCGLRIKNFKKVVRHDIPVKIENNFRVAN